jgi:hypothetical protein
MYRVLLVDTVSEGMFDLLKTILPAGFELVASDRSTPQAIVRQSADVDFILTISEHVTGEMINAGDRLKLVHKWGVGFDKIDLEAARKKGVLVGKATGINSPAVAEHAVMMILALYRQLLKADSGVRAGQWPKWDLRLNNYELRGKTIGIVGFGARASGVDIQQAFPSLTNPDDFIAAVCGIIDQRFQTDIQAGGVPARNEQTYPVSHSRASLAFKRCLLLWRVRGLHGIRYQKLDRLCPTHWAVYELGM